MCLMVNKSKRLVGGDVAQSRLDWISPGVAYHTSSFALAGSRLVWSAGVGKINLTLLMGAVLLS
jgi:hypothetical protein